MLTLAHVTHEAVRQAGGIGTVLRGLITADAYQSAVGRTLLIGPLIQEEGRDEPLGGDGEVLYDQMHGIWSDEVGSAIRQVEMHFGVGLVYGRRPLRHEGHEVWVEVLLVDTSIEPFGLGDFKYYLSHEMGIDSRRYEHEWEYEQYLRLSEPGYAGLVALLGDRADPCHVLAHEFMGLGFAYKTIMVGDPRFKTLFYAHEVATVRPLVEDRPGRDVSFYNALRRGRAEGAYIERYYGPQDSFFKHALVRQAWRCDAVLAVGDLVVEELRFLGAEFAEREIDLVYNGVPAVELSTKEKAVAADKLKGLCGNLLGWQPDWVFTHVTRLVRSKGLWRDLLVLEHIDEILVERGQRAVLIALTSEVGRRSPEAVRAMEAEYGWPLVHREGWPDLSSAELEFDLLVRSFNARSRSVRVLFVNQFGWDRTSCGDWVPEDISFADLRRGCDVEFGQSIYEPFGIAQVEPLGFGAVSVVSDVCGCVGFVDRSQPAGGRFDGLIVGNYTQLSVEQDSIEPWQIGDEISARVEKEQGRIVAEALAVRLQVGPQKRAARLRAGYETASAMSWERVAADWLVPVLGRLQQ
ncbi:MAG: hypothetical protein ACKVJG_05315 [Candidatus Latescibacterota bacterium]|jgi:hypothetical protein